jgi:hypothetical protein
MNRRELVGLTLGAAGMSLGSSALAQTRIKVARDLVFWRTLSVWVGSPSGQLVFNQSVVGKYLEVPSPAPQGWIPGLYRIVQVLVEDGKTYARLGTSAGIQPIQPAQETAPGVGVLRDSKPTPELLVVIVGDSFFDRNNAYNLADAFDSLMPRVRVVGSGRHGWTVAQLAAVFGTDNAPLLAANPNLPIVGTMMGGTNSLYLGGPSYTPQMLLNEFKSFVELWRATPRTVGCVLATVVPRSNPGTPDYFEAKRLEFNTLLRELAYRDPFVHLVDFGGDPILGQPGAELVTPLYNGDRAHPGILGTRQWAARWHAVMQGAAGMSRIAP